jgi:cation:H+ antiporter
MIAVVVLVTGLVLVVAGADVVVREGTAIADRMGIHPIVVGMTVVSLGTSLPELAIGLNAASQGNGGLAVGNIVGTNLVNILLVLGLAALLSPVDFEARTLRFDLPAMIGAAVLLLAVSLDGSLSTQDGVWLCLYGVTYLTAVVLNGIREARARTPATVPNTGAPSGMSLPGDDPDPPETGAKRPAARLLVLIIGLVVIVVGAELLVDGAVRTARSLGVSDVVIGLTVVAVGTSAPELVTTIVSTFRGNRSIAVGNLLGSGVFNIALILGPTVLVASGPLAVPDEVLAVDLILMVAAALICVPAFMTKRRLSRLEGGIFVTTYALYLIWLFNTRL